MSNDLLQHEYMQRHQELLHEAEQRRVFKHISPNKSIGRHILSRFGTFLITLGTKLEHVEQPIRHATFP